MRAAPLLFSIPLLAVAACGPGELDLSGPAIEVRGVPLASLGGAPQVAAPVEGSAGEPLEATAEATDEPATAPGDAPQTGSSEAPPEQGGTVAEVMAATLDPDAVATAAESVTAAQETPAPQPPEDDGEPAWVSWDTLSGFDYVMLDLDEVLAIQDGGPVPDLEERFPVEVVDLSGQLVELEGFMIPFEYDDRGIVTFTLVRDQAQCCFGASPQMNHWIEVEMREGERSDSFGMDPIFVRGTFSVGEAVQDGYVTSIYRLVADDVEAAW